MSDTGEEEKGRSESMSMCSMDETRVASMIGGRDGPSNFNRGQSYM